MDILERLVYQSVASHDFGSLHLFQLLTQARLRNEELNITGHLLYWDGHFTQCVEGPSSSLDLLWDSLLRDERHGELTLLARYPIDQRRFDQWSMAFSTYESLYVHGMTGFFPVDGEGNSPLVSLCQAPADQALAG